MKVAYLQSFMLAAIHTFIFLLFYCVILCCVLIYFFSYTYILLVITTTQNYISGYNSPFKETMYPGADLSIRGIYLLGTVISGRTFEGGAQWQ
eukprot:UN31963